MIIVAYAIAILLPLGFLYLIYSQDLFGQGKFKYVLIAFVWGLAAFGGAYGIATLLQGRMEQVLGSKIEAQIWLQLWLPVLILPQLLFTLGVSWFLAALGAFVRDLGQINGFLLTLWFFLTPICYPEASLSAEGAWILSKNPIFVLVRGYRDIFLEGRAPAWGPLWKLYVVSIVVFLLGHAWFYKLRKTFADII